VERFAIGITLNDQRVSGPKYVNIADPPGKGNKANGLTRIRIREKGVR
jgi:hypothetical protein